MELLEKTISEEGKILDGDILKVDGFLNHRMDVDLLCKLGEEFYRLFADCGVNKILTIEASGIGIACLTAQFFHCPVLFAKKSKSSNVGSDLLVSRLHSYTHNSDHDVIVSKRYLDENDRVLIIDDFMANGEAMRGLIDIVTTAGATLVGVGCAVENGFQGGGDRLRAAGINLKSLAVIESAEPGNIVFREDA